MRKTSHRPVMSEGRVDRGAGCQTILGLEAAVQKTLGLLGHWRRGMRTTTLGWLLTFPFLYASLHKVLSTSIYHGIV